MDNLKPHKVKGVLEAIEAIGAKLIYLPPYSPKLKAQLRKAAEGSIEALWTRIGEIRDALTPNECAAYLSHAGYAAK